MTYQSVPNRRGAFASAEKKHPFIDADSHIEDHDGIFDHLDRAYWHRRPKIVHIGDMIAHRTQRNYAWLIDGEMRPKMQGYQASCHASPIVTDYAKLKPVSTAIQGILDVDAYCAKMDEIQLDVATIYSTLFLQPLTRDPLFEAALMRSYNSWMAETCAKKPTRLKWAALLPMRLPDQAVKEVHRAKALGATSLMVLGTVGSVLLHDRRFDPVWAAAAAETGVVRTWHLVAPDQKMNPATGGPLDSGELGPKSLKAAATIGSKATTLEEMRSCAEFAKYFNEGMKRTNLKQTSQAQTSPSQVPPRKARSAERRALSSPPPGRLPPPRLPPARPCAGTRSTCTGKSTPSTRSGDNTR